MLSAVFCPLQRFCEGGSGRFDGGGSSGSNTGGDTKVGKKIFSDHEGNFGAESEITIAMCRLMGRSYAQKFKSRNVAATLRVFLTMNL